MTVGTVRQSLIDLRDFLDAAGASNGTGALLKLVDFLEPFKASTIAAFVKGARPKTDMQSSWTGQKVGALVAIVGPYAILTEQLAGKAKAKELAALVDLLKQFSSADLDVFISTAHAQLTSQPPAKKSKSKSKELDVALVEHYASALKAALGKDSEFKPLITSLKADKAAGKEEVAAIAKHVVSSMTGTPARAKAIQAITDLHSKAAGFNLKLKSMGGRTAA